MDDDMSDKPFVRRAYEHWRDELDDPMINGCIELGKPALIPSIDDLLYEAFCAGIRQRCRDTPPTEIV